MRLHHRYLLLALLLAGFAVAPLLAPGYFLEAHDAPHSLFFLVEFDQAIRDGALVPRWGPDHALGYGYPTFVFYSPLAYYLAEGFHLAGAGITDAVKATYAVGLALSAAGMFLLAGALAGPAAGLVAAVVYAFAPYRFVDMYVRSALAESFALALYPWVLWAFWRLAAAPSRRRVTGAALAYGALLLTHNVTAFLFTPLLGAFALFALWRHGRLRRGRAWASLAAAGALAVALAAFSLIPSLTERRYIAQDQWTRDNYNLSEHFVYLGQLLSPFWGYGYAVPGPDDDMSLQIGLVPLGLGLAGVLLARRDRRTAPAARLFGVAALAYAFLMLSVSGPVWKAAPLLSLAQFPWRLLGVVTLSLALLAGLGARYAGAGRASTAVVLCLLAVAAGLPYAQPQHTPPSTRAEQPVGVIDFELEHTDMRGMTAWAEHMPADSPKVAAYLAGEPLPLAESDVAGAEMQSLRAGGHVQTVLVRLPTAGSVRFHTYYYPGWTATVDGQPVSIRPEGELGVISLDVPAGEHQVSIRFGNTPLRTASNWITLAAVVALFFLALPPGWDHITRYLYANKR